MFDLVNRYSLVVLYLLLAAAYGVAAAISYDAGHVALSIAIWSVRSSTACSVPATSGILNEARGGIHGSGHGSKRSASRSGTVWHRRS
jgi:hypothetical protein